MLDTKTVQRIESFVAQKPRSLFEVAGHIGKSWRTTDRYVDEIAREFGTIATRTFREGTRGALKVVYWASMEARRQSVFQDQLEREILLFKKKQDFSAFDIYQHVPGKDKQVILIRKAKEDEVDQRSWMDRLEKTERQLLVFSGNLSWINLKAGTRLVFASLEKVVRKGIGVKILCRVDFASQENIQKALALNFTHGKELVEIRHAEQPLRGFVYDTKEARLKEIVEPTGKAHELSSRVFLFYSIKNKEWAEWLSRVFWKRFSQSVDAKVRLEELRRLG